VPLAERSNRRLAFNDPAVCIYDIAGICPHGLFKNTKSDLGPCKYETHSDHIDWKVGRACQAPGAWLPLGACMGACT
jgi:RNA-binding protein Luc7-like 2